MQHSPTTRNVRPPAVAGTFYPREASSLRRAVEGLLADRQLAEQENAARRRVSPKALIVPHAGYRYSGATAASAFAELLPAMLARPESRRVVLLGPSHHFYFRGIALPGASSFLTPLGAVSVDADLVARLAEYPWVFEDREAHRLEHALEVELPFLQLCLPAFTLLPLVVGEVSPAEVAEVLQTVWGGPETLVLISTDLSHFLTYEQACGMDQETAAAILDRCETLTPEQACGAHPLNGLLRLAARRGLGVRQLDLCNSGDRSGDRAQVVGYGAFALDEGG